jgi:hypothetical protein
VRIRGKYIFQSEIEHGKIAQRGLNTHTQIDEHIASTANPHAVTAEQVGKNLPQWNANQIYGRGVSPASPTVGQALVWDGLSWTPGSVASSGGQGLVRAILLPITKFGDAFFSDDETYVTAQRVLWPASFVSGTLSAVKAIAWADAGSSFSIRITSTTGNTVVAEASGSGTSPALVSLSVLTQPVGSLLEIQIKKNAGGTGRFVMLSCVELDFE